MSPMLGFHNHQWEPYHLTEIHYFPVAVQGTKTKMLRKPHQRLFECCLICGVCRSKDLAPGEIPPLFVDVAMED